MLIYKSTRRGSTLSHETNLRSGERSLVFGARPNHRSFDPSFVTTQVHELRFCGDDWRKSKSVVVLQDCVALGSDVLLTIAEHSP